MADEDCAGAARMIWKAELSIKERVVLHGKLHTVPYSIPEPTGLSLKVSY